MRYDVTYVAGNDEQTVRVEAAEAPAAVEKISTEHPDEPVFATEA